MTALEDIKFKELSVHLQKLELMLVQAVEGISEQIKKSSTTEQYPEWMTLEQAVNLKGGGAFATYESKREKQPLCGIAEGRVCGRKVWRRETVLEWLTVTDDDLDAYKKQTFEKMQKNKAV